MHITRRKGPVSDHFLLKSQRSELVTFFTAQEDFRSVFLFFIFYFYRARQSHGCFRTTERGGSEIILVFGTNAFI